MAISRMQQPRQMYNRGMMVHDPRQAYGLGGFIKKAVRGVKKIAKSPLGKMALIGGLGAYGMGLGPFSAGSKMFGGRLAGMGGSGFLKGLTSKKGFMGGIGNIFRDKDKLDPSGYGKFNMGKLALGGLVVATMAPLLMGGGDEEESGSDPMDPAAVTQRARNYYSGQGQAGVGLDFMPQKKYVSQNFYAADGGRAGYAMGGSLDEDEEDFIRSGAGQSRRMPTAFLNMGGGAGEAQAEQMLMAEFIKYKNKGGDLSFQQFVQAVMQQQEQSQGMQQPTMMAANGGLAGMTSVPGYGTPAGTNQFGYPSGGVRVGKAEGGIMETEEASEMIDMGGQEKDYRDEGGFVAMGGEERADDVPARLSKNEFVFTADAVRNAGGGDIDRGSEVMQNLMDNLEQGGQVSEDSQGLGGGEEMMSEEIIQEPDGAQAMYEQQQALQSRMA